MALTIPNEAAAGFADQAEPDSVDFDILVAGSAKIGVLSGCAVTAQGTPDMTVAVAAGTVQIGATFATVTAGNVTITAADGTNPRYDLITVDTSGTKAAVAGTAAANPVFPALPASRAALAAVYVPASDTAIASNQITDKRVFLSTVDVLSSTLANMPVAGTAGRLRRVSDSTRGLWMDTGTSWFPVAGKTINVLEFGAKGDVRVAYDAVVTNASPTITSATALFTSDDVGKVISLLGAATPTSITGTTVTTSGSTIFTVAGASFTQLDVGKHIKVPGAGPSGADLITTIGAIWFATGGTLNTAASTTQNTSRTVVYSGALVTTITGVTNGTTATIGTNAGQSATSVTAYMGTDDTAAFQAAFDATTGGVVIHAPAGTYALASTITSNKQISLIGDGIIETVFLKFDAAGTGNLFDINYNQGAKIYGITWRDFHIASTFNHTAGAAIRVGNVGGSSFENIKISAAVGGRVFDGIKIFSCNETFFDRVRTFGCANNGITVTPLNAGDVNVDLWFSDLMESAANLGHGLSLDNAVANVGTENIQGIYVGAGSYYSNRASGIRIAATNSIKNVFIRGTIIDSNQSHGIHVTAGAGQVLSYLRMQDCWVSFNGNPDHISGASANNMYLDAGTDAVAGLTDFGFTGGYNLLAGEGGIVIVGNATRGRIQNHTIADNNQSNASHYGIKLGNSGAYGPSKIGIIGNQLTNQPITDKQNGILVESNCADIDINVNMLDTGSGTTRKSISATATRVREWGNIEDAAAQTSVGFVDYNLAATFVDMIHVRNETVATAGVPKQYSPSLRFTGYAWDGTASQAVDGRMTLIPEDDVGGVAGRLSFGFRTGANAFTEKFTIGIDGRTPDPRTNSYTKDEFLSGTTATATALSAAGELKWSYFASGTGTALTRLTPESNRPGIYRLDTGATINRVASLHLVPLVTGTNQLPSDFFDLLFIIRLNTNDANTTIRMGLTSDASSLTPVNGIYVERLAADTQWFGVTRAASSQTRSTAIVTSTTGWARVRMYRKDASTIGFRVDDGPERTNTATIPTAALQPFIQITNTAGASKTVDIDYFDYINPGLAR